MSPGAAGERPSCLNPTSAYVCAHTQSLCKLSRAHMCVCCTTGCTVGSGISPRWLLLYICPSYGPNTHLLPPWNLIQSPHLGGRGQWNVHTSGLCVLAFVVVVVVVLWVDESVGFQCVRAELWPVTAPLNRAFMVWNNTLIKIFTKKGRLFLICTKVNWVMTVKVITNRDVF